MAGILFIISAPSGSGKSTLVSQLLTLVEGIEFSISYTTRAPRGSETNGREYHFTTREEFLRMVDAGEFLEWAEVFGNFYGTAASALAHASERGKDLLLDIDVQGALQVMKKLPAAVSIFILPPSPEVLELRLRNRSQAEHMTIEAVIERRLTEAREELKQLEHYRYALVNDVLDQAATELRAIVLSERIIAAGEQPQAADTDAATASTCLTAAPSPRLEAALTTFYNS
ncbi:guanylate kinase [Granulicella aggregans]|jgi:guanylate kinase|uniref:Guanylate kinase n=1 Tax=Granulicella aggregans TaxID=474949 RepID=A0A7W7ZA72_9BACT|nr:guanylate kinase [Granulicella aggregans]MBB5056007.1 guanylate kinase [Granulicella aggregans]